MAFKKDTFVLKFQCPPYAAEYMPSETFLLLPHIPSNLTFHGDHLCHIFYHNDRNEPVNIFIYIFIP